VAKPAQARATPRKPAAADAPTRPADIKTEGPPPEDPPPEDSDPGAANLSEAQTKDVEESSRLSAVMIYEILRREGEEEMNRPTTSLWWSGVAAGLSISVSLITQGVLQAHLPDTPWRPLVTGLGYTTGFLIVVLARHQLFTENTITAVLPVAARLTPLNLLRMGRLWGLVLIANLVGTFTAAVFCHYTPVISPDILTAMLAISTETIAHAPGEIICKGVAAGFLIAAMVWMLPSANTSQFHVILLMTYLIAIGGFAHVVAGSFEGFMLVLSGRLPLWSMLAGFEAPALLGNIIGGTALFALISYGQVAKEMHAGGDGAAP
jgi:formate/nitrite transporter FocA (FNT family)